MKKILNMDFNQANLHNSTNVCIFALSNDKKEAMTRQKLKTWIRQEWDKYSALELSPNINAWAFKCDKRTLRATLKELANEGFCIESKKDVFQLNQ